MDDDHGAAGAPRIDAEWFARTHNLRDFGGLPASDGRRVKRGLLYRSGAIGRDLPTTGVAWLLQLGIRSVIDVRSPTEVAADGGLDLGSLGCRVERVPFAGDEVSGPGTYEPWGIGAVSASTRDPARRIDVATRLAVVRSRDIYLRSLHASGPCLAALCHRVAAQDSLPMLVHCRNGKDRTGLLVAVLLMLLRVDRAAIVDDFALTNAHWALQIAAHDPTVLDLGLAPQDVAPLFGVHPDALRLALEHMMDVWGSAEEFASRVADVAAPVVEHARDVLLEPA